MKRITRKHLNDSIDVDTRWEGRKTIACKIYKGLAVTPSLNLKVPGYRITHVATGTIVTDYTFKLNQAWSVLLALEPLTDWTLTTVEDLAAHNASLTPRDFWYSVQDTIQKNLRSGS